MEIQSPSKQKIIKSVRELLEAKNLSSVKTVDIIKHSGISHQTFYRIFLDKYDACECTCFELLHNAIVVVGNNSTVRDQTMCILNIVRTNGVFFKHLLSCPEGLDVIKQTFRRLSEDQINFKSTSPVTNAWVYCLEEWCKSNFATHINDVYTKIISCYPIGEVVFGSTLDAILKQYGDYTMNELNDLCNSASRTPI